MANSPLISIIVPSRNRGELLRVCLDGIRQQTFTDFEVLIIDDGSKLEERRACEQLLKNYDERFKLHLIHAPDTKGSGASFTRNVGINCAAGEFIAFCDDDDFWCRNDYLEVAIQALQHQGADVCFSGIQVNDVNDQIIIEKMMPHVENSLRFEQKLGESDVYMVTPEQILCYPDYAHLNITITRRTLAEQIGGFWPYASYAEDVGFFIQLCDQAEKILFRPQICAIHNAPAQRSTESISNRMSLQNKRLQEAGVYQWLLLNCQSQPALGYVRKSLSDTYKMMTEEIKIEGNNASAAVYARMAWSVYPSLKWGLYTLWLSIQGKSKRSFRI